MGARATYSEIRRNHPQLSRIATRVVQAAIIAAAAVQAIKIGPILTWDATRGTAGAVIPHAGAEMVDFKLSVWAPGRALLSGHDPFTGSASVRAMYDLPVRASFYPPALWLALLPLILLPLRLAAVAMTSLTLTGIGIAIWLVLPRQRWSAGGWGFVALCVCSALAFHGVAAQYATGLGQTPVVALLGSALIVRGRTASPPGRRRDALIALGVVLCCLKLQFAIPAVILVAALGEYRAALAGLAVAVIASIPFAVLEVVAAHGFGSAVSSVAGNLAFLNRYNAAHAYAFGRVDLSALVTGWHPTDASEIAVFAVMTAVVIWRLAPVRRGQSLSALTLACLLAGYSLLCVDHNSYDDLVLCLPAALAVLAGPHRWMRICGVAFFVYEIGLDFQFVSSVPLLDRLPVGFDRVVFDVHTTAYLAPIVFFVLALGGFSGHGFRRSVEGLARRRPRARSVTASGQLTSVVADPTVGETNLG